MSSDSKTTQAEGDRFFSAAKMMSLITVISRVTGMLRDMAIASLGANRLTDTFVFAFRIPNLFRRLFGEGALTGAFVPIFSETAKNDGEEKANRLLANSMGLLAIFLTALMLAIQIGLAVYGWHKGVWAHPTPENFDQRLMLGLTAIMLPFMVSICMLALGSAALNCRAHFFYPVFAPVVLNICIISAAWWIAPRWHNVPAQLVVLSLSVTAASVVQLLGMLYFLRASRLPLWPQLRPIEPGVRPMLRLLLPTLLAMGFPQISSFFESFVIRVLTWTSESPTLHLLGWELTKPLHEGTQMHVYNATQLYQFPMGVLALSLSTAVFPLLSRYAANKQWPDLRAAVNRALRLAGMEGIVTGVGLFVLAEPITALLYQRHKFTPADSVAVADVLRMYVLGMWAFCTYQIFLRAFYSLKDAMRPLKVVAVMAVVNMVLVATLVWPLKARAFGIAAAVSVSLDVLVLAILLRKQLGLLGGRKLLLSLVRSCVASGAMAGCILAMLHWLVGHQRPWVQVSACVPAGAVVFVLAMHLLKAPELRELFRRG